MSNITNNNSELTDNNISGNSHLSWRVVDFVIAVILSVATVIIFMIWNQIGGPMYGALDATTPGLGGLALGIWLIGGVLGGLIIRKPGAAIFVETLAAAFEIFVSQWGVGALYSGLAQGLGAEIVFAAFVYKRFGLMTAVLSGMGAAVGAWLLEGFQGNFAKGAEFIAIYGVTTIISGAVLGGVVGYFLTKALAATGALDRFGVGREVVDA